MTFHCSGGFGILRSTLRLSASNGNLAMRRIHSTRMSPVLLFVCSVVSHPLDSFHWGDVVDGVFKPHAGIIDEARVVIRESFARQEWPGLIDPHAPDPATKQV